MKHNLKIQIFDFGIDIEVDNQELHTKLEKDFSYFTVKKFKTIQKKLNIRADKVDSYEIPKNLVATKQTENSIYYDQGNIRYNDYYGKALSIFDYEKEEVILRYCLDNIAHELLYLLILSRSGKYCDKKGIHKIHAAAVKISSKNIVFMMPSKGGKSTMLLELLRDTDNDMISDDTPVVSRWGQLKPFPLRMGHEDKNKIFNYFPYLREQDLYEFKRERFSKKYLIDIHKLKNKIGIADKTVLIAGFRSSYDEPKLVEVSKYKMFKQLKTHMIVGVGLPMIIEYFLQHTLRDHLINIRILTSRLISALCLLYRSETYFIYTSTNTIKNAKIIMDKFSER